MRTPRFRPSDGELWAYGIALAAPQAYSLEEAEKLRILSLSYTFAGKFSVSEPPPDGPNGGSVPTQAPYSTVRIQTNRPQSYNLFKLG